MSGRRGVTKTKIRGKRKKIVTKKKNIAGQTLTKSKVVKTARLKGHTRTKKKVVSVGRAKRIGKRYSK